MELPDWVVDDVLRPATPAAFRLVVFLFRHGRQVVDTNGDRRCYWRGSSAELARLVGLSKRHVLAAEHYLAETGFLAIHNTTRPNAPHAISARYDRPSTEGGYFLSPPGEADFVDHGDASSTPDRSSIPIDSTTTTSANESAEEVVTICNRLAVLGVTSPRRWLAQFGAERCAAALDIFEHDNMGDRAHNPAGLLYTLLTAPEHISHLTTRAAALLSSTRDEEPASAWDRYCWGREMMRSGEIRASPERLAWDRYTSGPLGFVVQTGIRQHDESPERLAWLRQWERSTHDD